MSRLKKIALMPQNMFQSQLDQISDKGRDVLKAIEDYKFFVEQTSRVMKNDPVLTETIISKKKNLEQASQQIYDVVFDIENLDIVSLYDRQEDVTNQDNEQNPAPEVDKSEQNKELADSLDSPVPPKNQEKPESKSEPAEKPTPPIPPADKKPESKEEDTEDNLKNDEKSKEKTDKKDEKKDNNKKDEKKQTPNKLDELKKTRLKNKDKSEDEKLDKSLDEE